MAPRSTRRPRSGRSGPPNHIPAAAQSDGRAQQGARDPRALLARISETPHLARTIPRLPAEVLHGVIQSCGLEDCGELLALATTEQLSAVFDLDLWRADRPGTDEQFDAARFGAWLEVFAESSVTFAARRLAEMDADLVIAGLADHIAVFDPAVFQPSAEVEGSDIVAAAALEGGLHCDVGGYTVSAKRTDSWDTIIAVLIALEEQHHDRFHRVMCGCRSLSNSKPEVDGLDNLLGDSEQVLFDVALDRERRRDRKGYVTPAQARAFLESSRQLCLDQDRRPAANPVFTAYLRAVGWSDESNLHREPSVTDESGDPVTSDESVLAVAAVVGVLLDAGVLPERPRALLTGSQEEGPRPVRLREQMEFVRERDYAASSLRTEELAFLTNVLVAGCSLQARPLTTREACDAAAATCNLGLENWPLQWLARSPSDLAVVEAATTLPEDFLVNHDLATVFQVGWTVLHKRVSMFSAEQLLGTLANLRCSDRETQWGLQVLRKEMTRHWRAGAPWRACNALDAIAILDMPAWAALVGLIGEMPVMLANVSGSGASQPLSVSTSTFEFISENRQIASVHEFLQSLPRLLSC
jgi:hypothetical protein